MAEQSPVFLGLIRPPKLLGLPAMYAMVWLFGSVLLFIWIQSLFVLLLAIIAYPLLWLAADWDPHFFDVVSIVSQQTPRTANRKVHDGGDSYAP